LTLVFRYFVHRPDTVAQRRRNPLEFNQEFRSARTSREPAENLAKSSGLLTQRRGRRNNGRLIPKAIGAPFGAGRLWTFKSASLDCLALRQNAR